MIQGAGAADAGALLVADDLAVEVVDAAGFFGVAEPFAGIFGAV